MLTALRAYASAAVLCAHCVARIRTAIRCDLDRLRLSLRNYANGIIISRSTIPTEPRWSFRRVSPGNAVVNEPPFQKSPAPTGMGAFHHRPINNARVACVFSPRPINSARVACVFSPRPINNARVACVFSPRPINNARVACVFSSSPNQ